MKLQFFISNINLSTKIRLFGKTMIICLIREFILIRFFLEFNYFKFYTIFFLFQMCWKTPLIFKILLSKCSFLHSHKKRKDSLEARAELAVLRTLRTKLYQNPFFFTRYQIVNKLKSRAARTVYGPISLPFYKIIFRFFFLSRCKQNKIKFYYSRWHFAKETQTNTV